MLTGALRRAMQSAKARLLTLLGVLATLATIVVIWPRFSAQVQEPLYADNPISVSFLITYDGYVPLRNVHTHCVLLEAVSPDVTMKNSQLPSRFIGPLGPGDTFTTACMDLQPGIVPFKVPGLLRVDILIEVAYRLPLLSMNFKKQYRFAAEPASDGKLRWTPIGLKHQG